MDGHLAPRATAGFSRSQTPWGALRHSDWSLSVIKYWYELKEAGEAEETDLASRDSGFTSNEKVKGK